MARLARLFFLLFILSLSQGCVSMALKKSLDVDSNAVTRVTNAWQRGNKLHLHVARANGQAEHLSVDLEDRRDDFRVDGTVESQGFIGTGKELYVDSFVNSRHLKASAYKLNSEGTRPKELRLACRKSPAGVFNHDTIGVFVLDEEGKRLGYIGFRRGMAKSLGPILDGLFICEAVAIMAPLHAISKVRTFRMQRRRKTKGVKRRARF